MVRDGDSTSASELDSFSSHDDSDAELPSQWNAKPVISDTMGFKQYRNIVLLSACWCLGMSCLFVQISTTTLAVRDFEDDSQLSTVPLGTLLFTSSMSNIVLPSFVHRYGEKITYSTAAVLGLLGAGVNLIGVLSRTTSPGVTVPMLVAGSMPQGVGYAVTNTCRFAVKQFSTEPFLPKATAIVVLGGSFATLLGPELALQTRDVIDGHKYAGSYIHLCALYAAYIVVLLMIDFPKPKRQPQHQHQHAVGETPRPLKEIMGNTKYVYHLLCQALSFSIMAALMAGTPLGMRDDGHSSKDSTVAIQMHMLGMFLPSIITGNVIQLLGFPLVIVIGFGILLGGATLFFADNSVAVYTIAITLVGVGWNLALVASSTVCTTMYKPWEKAKVAGANDCFVILFLGSAMFSTGFLYDAVGWTDFVTVYTIIAAMAFVMAVAYTVTCYCSVLKRLSSASRDRR